MALTDLQIRNAKTGLWGDGGNLYLQVQGASRSWIFRYKVDNKQRYLGLGGYPDISLSRARELAAEQRRLRAEGKDPRDHKREQAVAAKIEAAKTKTFDACAAEYIAAHKAEWSEKHHTQWVRTLAVHVSPVLGNVPVADITTSLVKTVLDPIWATKTATATRVRNRIELILDYAKVCSYREGENPARWRGCLKPLFAIPSEIHVAKHHAAVPYRDVPGFMQGLSAKASISAYALQFLLLTAARASEVRLARWDEFDSQKSEWNIPVARMKGRKSQKQRTDEYGKALTFKRPITKTMHVILAARPRDGEYVFHIDGEPITERALEKCLALNYDGQAVVHGLRSSFRTWCSNETKVASAVAERVLAHKIGNKTQQAYERTDQYTKRAKLMVKWDAYCTGGKQHRKSKRCDEPVNTAPINTATVIPYTRAKRRAHR
jgi:integrase